MITGLAILFFIFYTAFHGLPKIGWDISTKILNTKLNAKFNMDAKGNNEDLFFYSKSSVINDFKQFYFEIQA